MPFYVLLNNIALLCFCAKIAPFYLALLYHLSEMPFVYSPQQYCLKLIIAESQKLRLFLVLLCQDSLVMVGLDICACPKCECAKTCMILVTVSKRGLFVAYFSLDHETELVKFCFHAGGGAFTLKLAFSPSSTINS